MLPQGGVHVGQQLFKLGAELEKLFRRCGAREAALALSRHEPAQPTEGFSAASGCPPLQFYSAGPFVGEDGVATNLRSIKVVNGL